MLCISSMNNRANVLTKVPITFLPILYKSETKNLKTLSESKINEWRKKATSIHLTKVSIITKLNQCFQLNTVQGWRLEHIKISVGYNLKRI